jgi:hypothetical protein
MRTAAKLTQLACSRSIRHCSMPTASATISAMVNAPGIGAVSSWTVTARAKPSRIATTVRQAAAAESATVGCTAMTAPSGA